ncbi:retrovirus-related pol polyprotein from transposon TNT 1-94 [Tanacetum coccineum]
MNFISSTDKSPEELVDKPFGKMIIKLKWLWKNKKDEDHTVIRNKARLVAKGYAQGRVLNFQRIHLFPVLAWKQLFAQPEGFVDPDHPEKVYLSRKLGMEFKASFQEPDMMNFPTS